MKCQIFFLGLLFVVINEIKGKSDLKTSLTFVIDDTGSMGNDIAEVKRGANAIFDTVMNSNASHIEDFILVTFNDPGIKLRTVTTDKSIFKDALRSIHVYGGVDCPEMAMAGIKLALEKSRDAALLYVFTDASAKDYRKFAEVEALSQKKQIQVVFVLTGTCKARRDEGYLVYHKLAKATSGQVFHLRKTEVGKVLEYVKKTIESRKNVIANKVFPAGYDNGFDVEVDSQTKELVIAVSGIRPSVEVTDSSGAKMPTKDIARLSEIVIVNVLNIKPDVYKVVVGSETETYVKVSGTTSVHFQHGFSTLKPTSIDDTASRPIPGQKSYLSIKLSTEGANVELKTVQILDMDNHKILEVPVKVMDKIEQFYITEPIDVPNHMFKIAIKGYDAESKTFLTRISLTPIKPQDPTVMASIPEKAPIVTIEGGDEMDAEYDEPLQLKCRVTGYPAPDIIWESDELTGKTTQTDSTIELPSDFVSVLDINNVNKNATYTCKAVNKLGHVTKSIAVKTKKKTYFDVLELPKDITIEYAKEGEIHCKVDAFPPASISWFKNYKPLTIDGNLELSADNSTLYIRSMAPYIADKYICEARNDLKRNFTVFEVSISGVEAPVINKTIYYITAMKNSYVDIHCDVIKGKPKPTISWQYSNEHWATYSDLQVESDTIRVDYLTEDDSAIYTCKAENVVGTDSHDIELNVEYPPEATERTSPRIIKNGGEMVTLTCPVAGSPTPDVVWNLNGSELSGATISDRSISFKATISASGNYECVASNTHGAVRIKTIVDVIIPVNIKPPKQATLNVMVGTIVTLPCQADGFPTPVLSWIYHSKDPQVAPKIFHPSHNTGALELPRIQQEHGGYYTCVAKNTGSSENITYEVTVSEPPLIRYDTKVFEAVLDDVMLRVPCNASGNPKPTITWTKNGYDVATGSKWYDVEEDGSLIIKNIDKNAAGSYVCQARNEYSVDMEAFDVVVKSYAAANFITDTVELHEGKSANINCSVPHLRTDRVHWFKDTTWIGQGELQLPLVTPRDAGVYTCRVSSWSGVKTGSTMVITGSKPRFINHNEKEKVIEYKEGDTQYLDCTTYDVTKLEVKWLHDEASIDHDQLTYNVQMNSPSVKGRYTCIVTNKFGSAKQEFVVQTSECALDINTDFLGNAPLMLTPKYDLYNFEIIDGHVKIARDENILLYCPTTFTKMKTRIMMVKCENNKEFEYNGRKYLYSDFKCMNRIYAKYEKTKDKCNRGTSTLANFGFNVRNKFIPVYQMCLKEFKAIYSKLNVQPTLSNILPNYGFNDGIQTAANRTFNCSYQIKKIQEILGFEFHTNDGCCFEKRKFVDPKDVPLGSAQIATNTIMNTIPHWSTCGSQNWDDVEHRIRAVARERNRELQVWTGVAQDLQLPDANSTLMKITLHINKRGLDVPLYLWKVVQDSVSKASLAIIQVNVPDLQQSESRKYQLCPDICGQTKWMQSSRWRNTLRGLTYCCSLAAFESGFNFYGEFPRYTKILE